jgi:CMP-N-acetylneuraminic acid synthetase
MYKGKKILALIPARSGSKGIPDKNIRDFCGKPLLAYAIETALNAGCMDAVIVSTDSRKYADIAIRYGAEIPFLRPAALAGDESRASEYIVYTLEKLKESGREYDYFVLLQPTSPLRSKDHILRGIAMATDEGLTSVVAFSEAEHPPQYCHVLPEDMSLGALGDVSGANRQEQERYYRVNGMLYIADCEYYLRAKSFYGDGGKAMHIAGHFAVDIDTETDFLFAEFLYSKTARRNTENQRDST